MMAVTFNDLVDANDRRDEEIEVLKIKMADMEDKNKRNNIKIRGIPESVQQHDLRDYVSQLFKALLPDMSELDFTVDR